MITYVPLSPEYEVAAEMVTYQDAVERVLAHWDRHNEGRDAYFARSAVAEALRRMAQFAWKWYRASMRLTTTASYSTGTVAYTHSTRTVTLSDGTWPTLAALGSVLIDTDVYPVVSRVSDTEVTLRQDENPGADVAAGTTYKWFRDTYRLPPDIIQVGDLNDLEKALGGPDLVQFHDQRRLGGSVRESHEPTTYPWGYSIERDRRALGKAIVFLPPPLTARSYIIQVRRIPRPLSVEKYSTGTISVTSGSTTATGSGTAWSSKHVGCVLRISEDGRPPTSIYGARRLNSELDMAHAPAAVTRIVTAVASATSLTLDADPETTLATKAYTLSTPIDIDWPVCGTYWDRMVEYLFARNQMGVEGSTLASYGQQMQRAFLEAVDLDKITDPMPTGLPLTRGIYDEEFDFTGLEYL